MLEKRIDFTIENIEIGHASCFGGNCPLQKTAESNPLEEIKQKKDHAYLLVIAMGAGDYYGENNNGDFFYEKDLQEYYKTFETAGIFMQHDNKDPSKTLGKVLKAIYNSHMHRVELILEISKNKAPDIYEGIKSGMRYKVSMGVRVPQEICSFCGAITKGSIANRCDHLKFMMHQQMPNGQIVYAINKPPMNFFDISIVRRPADAQGHALFQKVASAENLLESKTAELIKRIEAIDTMPEAVSPKELSTFRDRFPKKTIIKLVRSHNIQLLPEEAMFLASSIHHSEFPKLKSEARKDTIITMLLDQALSAQECPFLKEASLEMYSNETLSKLSTRTYLLKTAADKELRKAQRKNLRQREYPEYKIVFPDGNSTTTGNTGWLSMSRGEPNPKYMDMIDKGYASALIGISPEGYEQIVYR